MKKRTICAVCGRECVSHSKWERTSDGHIFTVCIPCKEEEGKVNAESVNNFEAGHIADSIEELKAKEPEFTKTLGGAFTAGYFKRSRFTKRGRA